MESRVMIDVSREIVGAGTEHGPRVAVLGKVKYVGSSPTLDKLGGLVYWQHTHSLILVRTYGSIPMRGRTTLVRFQGPSKRNPTVAGLLAAMVLVQEKLTPINLLRNK